ncbi:MAG: DUF4430 domain-containing protein [Thermoleophilaceae bacterium]
MRRLVACLLVSVVLAGCGLGAGKERGGAGARLDVTRGFGQARLFTASAAHVREDQTVMRFLRANRRVTTSYGGGFVQSIDGLAGNSAQHDWFYFVNGLEASVGAASYKLSPGDVVQWDYRDWRATDHVRAIVGAYPEPFVHGTGGKKLPALIECASPSSGSCKAVQQRLSSEGVTLSGAAIGAGTSQQTIRVVVGPWSSVKQVAAAADLEQGPARSGVFARFAAGGALELLDPHARVARAAPAGTGLLAATKPQDSGPVWIVTGSDDSAAQRAAAALDPVKLRDAFAVAAEPGGLVRLPVGGNG